MVENVCSGVDEVVWYSWHWTIVSEKWVSSAIVGCGGGVSHIVRQKVMLGWKDMFPLSEEVKKFIGCVWFSL